MLVLSDLPQVSASLPWHNQELSQLAAQLAERRLPHALLLTGRQLTGKSQFALALSRLLLCSQPEQSLNCGRCHSCELSAKGNHGDLRWVEPLKNSRGIKIEQIRELVPFTSATAGLGSRKVIVLAPANRMNINAFNALLKLLEEPPTNTYIILVCNEMQNVPATIRSRCQIRHLATPTTEASLRWLNDITQNPEQSRLLLTIAAGLPLLAQQLYLSNDIEGYITRQRALDSLAAERLSVHEVALLWANNEIAEFLEYLGAQLQFKIGTLSTLQLKMKPVRVIFSLLDEIYKLQRSIISGANPNKQLIILSLLSKYQTLLGTGFPGDNIPTMLGGACK